MSVLDDFGTRVYIYAVMEELIKKELAQLGYSIFQNKNKIERFSFWCLRELKVNCGFDTLKVIIKR